MFEKTNKVIDLDEQKLNLPYYSLPSLRTTDYFQNRNMWTDGQI
jgi:hypothetical protein